MDAAVAFAKFAALNGATVLAACALASRLRFEARSQRLLAAAVLAVGIANASALALGLLGWLYYGPLLAVQAAVAAISCVFARGAEMRAFLDPRPAARLVEGTAQRLALALLAVAYAYSVFLGIVSEAFAGDELMYHLPLVAEYARNGRIVIPELGRYWANHYWAYYPGGAYLLDQWFVLPFGTGALVDLVQLPYAFAAALASYVLARLIGARRRDALWAAILFLAVPIVMNQVKTALVDVSLTFLFAAGLAFLLLEPLRPIGVLLAAIAWGAAPGVKLPAMMYMALGAVCVALTHLDRERSIGGALRKLVPAGAVIAAGIVLLSGYWFARNAWLMGSPTYPLDLHPEPNPAWTNIIYYGLLFPLLDFSPATPEVFNYETGAGPQFMCLAVPALLAYAAAAWRERRLGGIAFAVLPIVAYAVWLLRLSTSVQTLLRYVLPAMPLGFAAFAWLLPRLRRRGAMVALALASVGFSFFVGVPRLGSYTNQESLRLGLAEWRRGAAATRFAVMGSVDLQDYRRAWAYFDRLPGPHSIVAAHLIFTYPMMGADFRHALHVLEATDYESWMVQLRARHADHVAVAQRVDKTGTFAIDGGAVLRIRYAPAADEALAVTRSLPARPVRALRLRYRSGAPDNARAVVGVNRFAQSWELPLGDGTSRTQVLAWSGTLNSIDLGLDFIGRTSLRAPSEVVVESLELQGEDGEWATLPIGRHDDWQVLPWPLEYYWMEARPERFKPVLRDVDYWGSKYSGELRVYRVEAENDGPKP